MVMKNLCHPLFQPVSLTIFHSFLRCIQGKRPFQNKSSQESNLDLGMKSWEWKDAMREEMSALEKNKTWEIVERPKGKNIVDCKWIFTLKYKANGSLERHKTRLVAKGYTQTYGVDYQETFAPVAKMNTVRILLSLAAHYNWQLLQKQGVQAEEGPVWAKTISQGWFGRFAKVMKESGYKQNQETGKIGCKPVSTPMDPNHKLGEAKEEPMVDKRMYQRLIGRLIYLAHTRPDIAYSVSVISQFMHDPREPHLQAAYRVLHYLKGNPEKGILFKKNNTLALEAYTDADYAGSLVDRRSTTGYCTFLGGNLIILDDLRIKWDGPMKLYCDNKSAINSAHNPIQYDRTKHIEIDRHFIKEKLEEGVVYMSYVPSEHQLADILTKGLNSSMFHDFVFKLEWKTSIPQLERSVEL
ncbi:Retrovirus-related Pol polyprotein from transposon RE1 [Vitis vinifera]|uniref:Retrovirus-related Pol polyprotein from transposon RE1 n=1 Tax=Vitis vinifera TaxID=29760 RepID=A0A438K6K8_VITVI|nr:Retrovirus-related Pol polyprotein from transposon RE1 [Vitis vinifera]